VLAASEAEEPIGEKPRVERRVEPRSPAALLKNFEGILMPVEFLEVGHEHAKELRKLVEERQGNPRDSERVVGDGSPNLVFSAICSLMLEHLETAGKTKGARVFAAKHPEHGFLGLLSFQPPSATVGAGEASPTILRLKYGVQLPEAEKDFMDALWGHGMSEIARAGVKSVVGWYDRQIEKWFAGRNGDTIKFGSTAWKLEVFPETRQFRYTLA
jgi:hypothetical protein